MLYCLNILNDVSLTFIVLPEVICLMLGFSAVILITGVNRVVGGSAAAAHKPAESNGCCQPTAAA